MKTLNTTNPDFITYQYDEIQLTVLGGISTNHLDRMRVTLKTEFKTQAIRHNLDLYNDTQVERLIKKSCERFAIGITYMQQVYGSLTGQLENYRLEEIKKAETKTKKKVKTLTAQEVQEAADFLKQNNLLKTTSELLGKSGIVGEELNRLIMYIVFTSRKLNKPLHIISFGSSGTGKTHLQEKVSELIPEEDKIEITSLTGNAFYYFESGELGHKLILIEDMDGALAALYPIRELQSKQRISKTLTIKDTKGNTKTIHLKVQGPVCVSGCTTQTSIYEDNANRSFLLYLDESEEQDERIMAHQRRVAAGKVNEAEEQQTKELLKNTQRILKPIKVINPYAELLQLPPAVFKPRRTNAHYLAFIEAITFYKQYQREQKANEETGEIYIQTTLEDIEDANRLIKPVLLRKSDELSKDSRSYFEQVKTYLKSKEIRKFSNKEIRDYLRIHPSKQKRLMNELQEYGLIKKGEGDQKKGFMYEVSTYEDLSTLESRISTVLDNILLNLKQQYHTKELNATTGTVGQQIEAVHKKSKPLKPKSNKGSNQKNEEDHNN